jgi:hypothetical protein
MDKRSALPQGERAMTMKIGKLLAISYFVGMTVALLATAFF